MDRHEAATEMLIEKANWRTDIVGCPINAVAADLPRIASAAPAAAPADRAAQETQRSTVAHSQPPGAG